MGVFIADFGRNKDGLFLYRVNGDKKQIEKYIEELNTLGCEFYEPIEFETAHKCSSVLLKIKFPPEVEEKMEEQKRMLEEKQKESFADRERIRNRK